VGIFDLFAGGDNSASFKKNLKNVLGFKPSNSALYKAALTTALFAKLPMKIMSDSNTLAMQF